MRESSLFSTPSPAFIVHRLFDDGHSDQCEVISHCSFDLHFSNNKASLVAQMVQRLSAMLETRVLSLGWEDPLEKEMATHSNILAWKIPWTEEPGYNPWGCKESDVTERLDFTYFL